MSELEALKRVDALLDNVLPPPRVRAQLRLAAGLTQKDVADAVGVQRLAVVRWELGQSHPRRPHRDAYAHLLQRLAERFPHATEPRQGTPVSAPEEGAG
ncbi:helix-turn-helix domain-containing protein [Streptomyces sp. SID8356]|uniref:helix-turn-helix transcriptional regulator n=1 Tax=unclassified Streptomyces TaxID=2593676 RepID=UPI000360BBD6|nr:MULTISPECIES: helix-turn-helix transcriptional regulator [unclassified Streptomyces]MYT37156.1 helix-turn-helix domain-containing protein [Streptomyces sp. SID8356]